MQETRRYKASFALHLVTVGFAEQAGGTRVGRLAIALARMRQQQRFVVTAWFLLPDRWHGGLTVDRVFFPPMRTGGFEAESRGPTRQVHASACRRALQAGFGLLGS